MGRLIARRVDLSSGRAADLGFVVGMHALDRGGTLITFQLHHALGDARSLGLLLRCMFGSEPPPPTQLPQMRVANVLWAAVRHGRASVRVLRGRSRMLSARGVSLPRDADEIGVSLVTCAAFELAGGWSRSRRRS